MSGYEYSEEQLNRNMPAYLRRSGTLWSAEQHKDTYPAIDPQKINLDGKKVFTVTDAGKAYLQEHVGRLAEINARLEHQGGAFERGRSPEIMRAFVNLRSAIQARAVRGKLTPDQVKQIAEAIDKAAAAVDAL